MPPERVHDVFDGDDPTWRQTKDEDVLKALKDVFDRTAVLLDD